MAARAREDARRSGTCALLLVLFLVLLVLIGVDEIAIFAGLVFFVIVVLFVRVIGDEVQVDGMRLGNLEFGFALGTTQDLAFFDFVFIDIDFGGTFRATDHGSTLRTVFAKWGIGSGPTTVQRIIYRDAGSQLPCMVALLWTPWPRGQKDHWNELF
jgi:hypothetical protein